jgi:hypothetical protein
MNSDGSGSGGAVTVINFAGLGLAGIPNFTMLPSRLQELHFSNAMDGQKNGGKNALDPRDAQNQQPSVAGFSGTVDLTNAPPSLWYADISGNFFTGRVSVPRTCCTGLKQLFLHYNRFTYVDLSDLPSTSLEVLTLFGNQLTSTSLGLQLAALPRTLTRLVMWSNANLTGPVDLTRLPAGMLSLGLDDCAWSGKLQLDRLPATLQLLALGTSRFCGSGIVAPPHVCSAIYVDAAGPCKVNCTASPPTFDCGPCK